MAEDEVIQVKDEEVGEWAECDNATFSSWNMSDCDRRRAQNAALANAQVAVLASLLIFILVSNLLVLVALIRSSLLRPMSRTYYFMLHICAADLMVGLFNVLSQLAWELTDHFRGPNWLCKGVKFMQVMPLYLSPLLLTCLALDRYRAMSFRLGGTMWSSQRMVAAVWTLSAILALPQAFLFSLQQRPPGHYNCWVDFGGKWSIRAYVVYFVMAAFFGPMMITVYCYTCITLKVWRYSRYRRGYVPLGSMIARRLCCITEEELALTRNSGGLSSGSYSLPSTSLRITRVPLVVHSYPNVPQPLSLAKMKTIKLTFIITFFFIVCHAPFSATQLYYAFSGTTKSVDYHPVSVIMLLLPSLPSCVNPWIYLCFSDSLLKQICGCMDKGLRRARENISIGDQEPEDHVYGHGRRDHRRRMARSPPSYNRRGFYAYRFPSTLSDQLPNSRPKEHIELAVVGASL